MKKSRIRSSAPQPKAEFEEPTGPPPPWIAEFRRDLRQALADTADDQSAEFDPPEGTSLADLGPDGVVAVFIRKPTKERTDGCQ